MKRNATWKLVTRTMAVLAALLSLAFLVSAGSWFFSAVYKNYSTYLALALVLCMVGAVAHASYSAWRLRRYGVATLSAIWGLIGVFFLTCFVCLLFYGGGVRDWSGALISSGVILIGYCIGYPVPRKKGGNRHTIGG